VELTTFGFEPIGPPTIIPKEVLLDEASGFEREKPVENDRTATDSETRVAFVYGQRYVSAERLRASPDVTTELWS
jgi:hypothetical protein